MEKDISINKFIVAGVLSGAVFGIVLFIAMIAAGFSKNIYPPAGSFYLSFLASSIYGFIFVGLIIGMVSFLLRNKMNDKKLLKYALLSTCVMVAIMIPAFFLLDENASYLPFVHFGNVQFFSTVFFFYPLSESGVLFIFWETLFRLFGPMADVVFGNLFFLFTEGAIFGYVFKWTEKKLQERHKIFQN